MTPPLDLYSLIANIPATFWGVVTGSFFSIIGVSLSNRASDKRLRFQFDHERTQKTKDREMTLRKDVFLAAAEAIQAGTNSISRFSNLDIAHEAVTKDYVDKSPVISRVHVIAKTDTVIAMANFTGQLNVVYLKLFARRHALLAEKTKIQLLDSQMVIFGKERDRILEMIKQFSFDGLVNDQRWAALQGSFQFEQNRVSEAISQRNEIVSSLFPMQLEFTRECVAESARMTDLIIPLLAEVRKELELPFDEEIYRRVIEDGKLMQKVAINNFIQEFMPKTDVIKES